MNTPDPYTQYMPPIPPPPPRRKSHRTRNILVSVASAVFLLIVVGVVAAIATANPGEHNATGSQNASPPAAAPAATKTTPPSSMASLTVGQAEHIEDNGVASDTATITVTSMSNTTQSSDPYGEAPQYGYYVIANVSASSQFNGFDVNELDFYVLVNGQHYDVGNGNSYFGDENATDITTTLNAGESVSGQLLFDLPSPHGTLVYSPNFNGAPVAEWSF